MEQPEVPIEHLQEHVEHHAHTSGEQWVSWVALSTAILAAFAAVCSLLAGFHANEAMINEIESANQWAFYQAKGIKSAVLDARLELLKALNKPIDPAGEAKLAGYAKQQQGIRNEAEHRQTKAETHLHQHVLLARGVTMFQISIAVSAISALTKKRRFWFVGLAFGLVGVVFLIQGLLP